MKFSDIIDQAKALLQRQGRMTYRSLKREFDLEDEALEDLKFELIEGQAVAVDQDGKLLVWKGTAAEQETEKGRNGEAEPRHTPSSADAQTERRKDSRRAEAERRQLTVMFCDLVGSTALSTQLDPEDYHTIVQRYHQTCEAVIQRYDGFVPQHLGDGLLVYFGYPSAHEDDASRAVRTALGIVEAIQQLSFPTIRLPHPLQVRIGIHTGLVVIGEIGSSETREMLALGETPNLAARVQGVAEPNTVVMSMVTHRLVQGLFESQELGPQKLKGFASPVAVYRVVKESAARNRFEAEVRRGLTPLVGRELEMGLLRERWERVKAGAGQVVLLNGEPGIGKSRLVQELKNAVIPEGAVQIEYRCSPYHQNSAFYPLVEHVQRVLQFTVSDTPQDKLGKLQETLSRYRFPQAETVPLMAALLSLPHPEGCPPITVSPQKQKERTQAALVAWLLEEAELRPIYTVWEDLHWADPSTLEVLTLFLDQVPTTRLLALLTSRPEFGSPWGSRSYITHLTLTRLGRPQVEAMIEQVAAGKPLPAEVVEQIRLKTDGVPLFVEELTKAVVESGLLIAVDDHYELRGPLPPLAIPATLQDSLMARLDRLSTVREIAQLSATLGREFDYELLHAVSPLDEERLQQGLKQLVEAELVYQSGLPPQAHYLFKHALIQDTAYQSLLKSTRQHYHTKIAQVLVERFPETVETQPELVAHHYTVAGLIEQALPYWQQAGERANQRSAYVEAISHLTTGLEVLKALPDTPERTQQELALQTTLGSALIATKGYAAPEVEKAYTRARELCQQVGETPQLSSVLLGLGYFYCSRAEHKTARELSEQLLSLAQRQQDPLWLLWAYFGLGACLFVLGEFIPTHEHFEQGIALYDSQKHNPQISGDVNDPEVVGLSYAALVLWLLGYPDQALKRSREALTLAQELSHPHSLAGALGLSAWLHQLRREWQLTQERAEAAIAVSSEQGFPSEMVRGTIRQGWALAEQGQGAKGVAQIRQSLVAYQATGSEVFRPYFLALLAEAYEKAGQANDGLNAVAEALAAVDNTEERFYEAELYRLRGELTLQQFKVQGSNFKIPSSQHLTSSTQAETCFLKAIEVTRKQQAKSWELRASTSLAQLWKQQGKKAEARQMLADIYNWFTEGFDTKDLQEAKALLEALS